MLPRSFNRQNRPPLKTPSVFTFSKTADDGYLFLMLKSCTLALHIASLLKESKFILILEAVTIYW